VTKSRLVFTRRLEKELLEALKWAEKGGFGEKGAMNSFRKKLYYLISKLSTLNAGGTSAVCE